MNYVNLFKKEIKTKWSTRLLIAVLMLIVGSIFAANIVLKHQYDLKKDMPKDPLKGYTKIVNQSFKHIKIDNCLSPETQLDTSSQCSVFIKLRTTDLGKLAEKIFVKNDTLFITAIDHNMTDFLVRIFAPKIETIDASKSKLYIASLNQKSITINLFNVSHVQLSKEVDSMDFLKISLKRYSNFEIDIKKSKQMQRHQVVNIQTVEADLKDSSTLHLGFANVKNFKLNATEGNAIELSSETMNALIKK